MNTPQKPDESIFEAALQLPPEQRAGYLDQACDGDVEMHQRLKRLIRDEVQQTVASEGDLEEELHYLLSLFARAGPGP